MCLTKMYLPIIRYCTHGYSKKIIVGNSWKFTSIPGLVIFKMFWGACSPYPSTSMFAAYSLDLIDPPPSPTQS